MAGPTSSLRPKPRPSMGERIMSGIRSAGAQIKSDFAESRKPASEQSQDYKDRTAASRAAHEQFLEQSRRNEKQSSGATQAAQQATPEKDMAETYAENKRRYEEYMQSQQPQRPTVTPEMRREALNIFESQQGAGQVPYYMAAARNAQNPNMSPAFQYAAQNYDVLGGSQRLGPRPMEMMSVAERRQINDMAQAMADQQAQQDEYRRGMDMVLRGGGKGGPKTAPQQGGMFNSMQELMDYQNQNPSMNLMGEYQRLKALEGGGQPPQAPQRFGGKGGAGGDPRTAQLGAMLAQRFGRMY